MPLYMPQPGADFAPPPAGSHTAVCYRVIDLGTQETTYLGEVKSAHKIMIGWELPEEKMEEGRPFTIAKRYTYSSHKKSTLRIELESWRGVPFSDSDFGTFDICRLLGAGCMMSILHAEKDGRTYANINSIMRLPKGMKAPAPENDLLSVILSPEDFKPADFGKLSEKMQAMIMTSPEYKKITSKQRDAAEPGYFAADPGATLDDEIPF